MKILEKVARAICYMNDFYESGEEVTNYTVPKGITIDGYLDECWREHEAPAKAAIQALIDAEFPESRIRTRLERDLNADVSVITKTMLKQILEE